MNLKQSFIKKSSAFLLPAALLAVAVPAQAQQQVLTQNKPVAPTRQNVTDLGLVSPSEEANVTVFLNMHNKPEFDAAVEKFYDPSSPTYRKWMTGPALVKYAPTAAEITTVQKELEKHGLTILSVDPDNFSIRAHGTTANLEAAFQTHIHSYSLNGKTFKANVEQARLTGAAGALVAQVSGLEQHHATPMTKYALNPRTKKPYAHIAISKVKAAQASGGGLSNFITANCLQAPTTHTYNTPGASQPVGVYYGNGYTTVADSDNDIACSYTAAQLQQHYGLPAAYAAGFDGHGKTVVLLEAYGYPYMQQDANTFSQLMGLPALTSSNFQVIYPQVRRPIRMPVYCSAGTAKSRSTFSGRTRWRRPRRSLSWPHRARTTKTSRMPSATSPRTARVTPYRTAGNSTPTSLPAPRNSIPTTKCSNSPPQPAST